MERFDVYAMSAGGTRRTNLTRNASTNTNPSRAPESGVHEKSVCVALLAAVSVASCGGASTEHAVKPSGTVAFVAVNAVWIVHADGTGRRRLTPRLGDGEGSPLRWSRDGQHLAFTAAARGRGEERRFKHNELFVARADGRRSRRLTWTRKASVHVYNSAIGWSRDGHWIVVERNDDGPVGIFSVRADGGGERLLTPRRRAHSAALSADGRRIVYRDAESVYVMNLDGRDLRRIERRGGPTEWSPGPFEWSADGRLIAFLDDSSGKHDLWVMDAMGRNARNLSRTRTPETHFAWAPDKDEIVYTSRIRPRGDHQIWLVNADGGSKRQLTSTRGGNERAAWSPDGRWIAFVSHRDGAAAIYVMNADGSGQTRLTPDGQSANDPVWSPVQ